MRFITWNIPMGVQAEISSMSEGDKIKTIRGLIETGNVPKSWGMRLIGDLTVQARGECQIVFTTSYANKWNRDEEVIGTERV